MAMDEVNSTVWLEVKFVDPHKTNGGESVKTNTCALIKSEKLGIEDD